MKLSPQGLGFIKGFESFVPYVYDDLVPAKKGVYREWKNGDPINGTLTIGWGHTDAARYKLGFKLKDAPENFRITKEQGDKILAVDLEECEEDVLRLVKKPLTQGQFDACASFTFNCGAGNFANIAKRINAGNYSGARAAFDLYVKSKGQTLRGLQRRRDGEQALWDANIPTVPTEVVDHPAEVDAPPKVTGKELAKKSRSLAWIRNAKKTILGAGLTGILAAIAFAKQIAADIGDIIGQPAVALSITILIVGGLFFWYVESEAVQEANDGLLDVDAEEAA